MPSDPTGSARFISIGQKRAKRTCVPSAVPLVPGGEIGIHPVPRATPLPIGTAHGLEASALRCAPQSRLGDTFVEQRGKRDETRRAGNRRDDELVEVVEHGSSEQFPQLAVIARVGPKEPA